jgi:hypothetical protein
MKAKTLRKTAGPVTHILEFSNRKFNLKLVTDGFCHREWAITYHTL